MKTLLAYLKREYRLILMLFLFCGIFAVIFMLYNLPYESVGYAALLCLATGGIFFGLGCRRYLIKHRILASLLQNTEEAAFKLPAPSDSLEKDYQILLRAVAKDRADLISEKENKWHDLLDYYTLWAHQIKTPIAATDLLLQEEKLNRTALSAEVMKTEEYVEMALSYLHLDSETTDYVFAYCPLDRIVHECIKKYARVFILKKMHLDFQETNRRVLTDEKWLSFVIGQLLSNALKYSPDGGIIKIFGEGNNIFIKDNGIGIRAEDLPRIFEKGFTGYNGREDKKASGLGLYLCKQIMDKLGHKITAVSEPGKGTAVILTLDDPDQVIE